MSEQRREPEPGSGRPDCRADETPEEVHLRPLPPLTRALLLIAGGLLFAIGLVGLALPIIPQTIPLVLGLAILSLASRWVHDLLERLLNRWPRVRRVVAQLRKRVHDRLS